MRQLVIRGEPDVGDVVVVVVDEPGVSSSSSVPNERLADGDHDVTTPAVKRPQLAQALGNALSGPVR